MRILMPGDIRSGPGASDQIGQVLASLGLSRPLLVVDPAVHALGLDRKLLATLERQAVHYAVVTKVSPDPTIAEAEAAAGAARENRSDCIIGIGGGSAMDIAKAAALLSKLGGEVRDYALPRIVDETVLPIVCVPTTAGTGSEVTRAAVVTDEVTQEKLLLLGTALLPKAALVDPELSLSCPFRVTADSGLDALSHALEALVNRNASAFSDGIATEALRVIGRSLVRAAETPDDLTARSDMMVGAMLAGIAVSHTSTALIHGMSRPIGAAFHVPHGMANAMLMPMLTSWSGTGNPKKYAMAAQALGVGDDAQHLSDALLDLNRQLKVPRLRDRVPNEKDYRSLIPKMVQQAQASGTPGNNPRIASDDEMAALYHALWDAA